MTVRRTPSYSDTWDQFIQKVYGLNPQNTRTDRLRKLIEQLGWDQKIGMIVALSHEGGRRARTETVARFGNGNVQQPQQPQQSAPD